MVKLNVRSTEEVLISDSCVKERKVVRLGQLT